MSELGPDERVGVAEDAARILALLAEPERLRVVAALVLGYSSVSDITLG
jgi:DNA-binding transcriptional ArsR family regulator